MNMDEATRRVMEATYRVQRLGIPIDAFGVVFAPEDFYTLAPEARKDGGPPLEYRFGGLPVAVDRSLEPGTIHLRVEVVA